MTLTVAASTAFAVIDDEDASLVLGRSWYLCNGYARTDVWANGKRRHVYMHRLLAGLPGAQVDHIDGDKLNNRRSNLRAVTRSQNLQNRSGATKSSFTKVRGVFVDKRDGTIYARVRANGRNHHLGRFATLEAADAAAREARKRLMTHSRECST